MTCAGNIQCYFRNAWQFDSLETGLRCWTVSLGSESLRVFGNTAPDRNALYRTYF